MHIVVFIVRIFLNKYLNTANLYLKAGISDTELSKLIKEDLNKKVEVGMLDKQNEVDLQCRQLIIISLIIC